ncbi:agmatinase family protein [Cytobacillus sp. Hz8]|uniref:agmatinase family protein n=1 Tax=Cytobacillus sp. Hz8 TaxID=3347168 RepID=UPI0035DA6ECA
MNLSKFQAPSWNWNQTASEAEYVHQWVKALTQINQVPDLILYGAPISKSSISVSGASLYPDYFRRMWRKFATYNLDEDIDLKAFLIGDAGDVIMHTTNIPESHQNIEESTAFLVQKYPQSQTCLIGGDHSITACAVRGIKKAFPLERIGILQIDTHLDVRDPCEWGPANGTPIRQLIDGGIVLGKDVVNIGLHGYFNTRQLVDFAKKKNIHMVTLNQARKQGLKETIQYALQTLSERVKRIYVTVDMDVLDISAAPGVAASTPGGMTAAELFLILLEIGKHPSVAHIDYVCLDPTKDNQVEETVKIGVYSWLQFITGCLLKKQS